MLLWPDTCTALPFGAVQVSNPLTPENCFSKTRKDIQFVSFPEALFKLDRVQDPVLGNTSILAADFNALKTYVQKFNEGRWFEPDANLPDPVTP